MRYASLSMVRSLPFSVLLALESAIALGDGAAEDPSAPRGEDTGPGAIVPPPSDDADTTPEIRTLTLRPPDEDALTRDRGWPAGTIQDELDRDPTLVPFGKGSIFVPAMTNPLDEPTVAIWKGSRPIAEGTTGARIVLAPGTYEVRLGSGAEQERLKIQATVRELHTTVIPVSWAGLSIHVVDEQYGSFRGAYELIRVEDREYVGIGFGTDEQAGEPVSTWILRPGLYKIVRVGENYRARRDFATVRITGGQLTHFLLVVDKDSGEFAGGGEVPERDLFRPREGFFGSLVLGGDFTMNARSNVPGLPQGVSFGVRAFADSRTSIELADNPLVLQLQIEEGQTKSPELPWQKSIDRADLDALYVYRIANWIGPYLRFGAETNLLPGEQFFKEPKDVVLLAEDGSVIRTESTVDRIRLSPSLGLTTLKEGTGINVRLFKTVFAESTVRTGVGGRHRLTRDLFDAAGDTAPPLLELEKIASTHQVGVEVTALATARLTRWVIANLELDSLVPFDLERRLNNVVLELNASAALKLTTYVSLNYVIRFLRDRALTESDLLQQDVLLRFSLELL